MRDKFIVSVHPTHGDHRVSGGLSDSFIHRESLRLSVFRPRQLTCSYYHYASCFSEYILKLRYEFDFFDLHEPNDNKALSPVRRQYHQRRSGRQSLLHDALSA